MPKTNEPTKAEAEKPNPGSKEAQEHGCTCPVYDNCMGQGIPDGKGGYNFWMNGDCPLHGFEAEAKE